MASVTYKKRLCCPPFLIELVWTFDNKKVTNGVTLVSLMEKLGDKK